MSWFRLLRKGKLLISLPSTAVLSAAPSVTATASTTFDVYSGHEAVELPSVLDQLDALSDGVGVDEVIVKVQWTSGTNLDVLTDQLGRWLDVCSARSVV